MRLLKVRRHKRHQSQTEKSCCTPWNVAVIIFVTFHVVLFTFYLQLSTDNDNDNNNIGTTSIMTNNNNHIGNDSLKIQLAIQKTQFKKAAAAVAAEKTKKNNDINNNNTATHNENNENIISANEQIIISQQQEKNSNNEKNLIPRENIPQFEFINAPIQTIPKTKTSNHPQWKLWHEYKTQVEKAKAIQAIQPYIQEIGLMIGRQPLKFHVPRDDSVCTFQPNNQSMTACQIPSTDCIAMSIGISDDPSLEVIMSNDWKCKVYTTDHRLFKNKATNKERDDKLYNANVITFPTAQINRLRDFDEDERPKQSSTITGNAVPSTIMSIPSVMKYIFGKSQRTNIHFLKIDCEGCELAMARDILVSDINKDDNINNNGGGSFSGIINFFDNIQQISLHTHVTKLWINSQEEMYYFGVLFALLKEANYDLITSRIGACSFRHEKYKCLPHFELWKYPCGLGPSKVVCWSCQQFLFLKHDLVVKE